MNEALRLIMAQVDDVPGELLGEFIRRVEALGARNVQIVASVTKKGRPGYIIYVDVPGELEDEVAAILGGELGAWGYRVLDAQHRHFDIERFTTALTVAIGGRVHEYELRAKSVSMRDRFLRIKAEHDDLSAICAMVRDAGNELPLAVLKAGVETALADERNRSRLMLEY